MVFSTTASAFLHVNEHHHEQSLGEHYHSADSHQHDTGNSTSADHAHHFNLHVVGDIVDHKPITLAHAFSVTSCEYSSQLISRTDSPPLPPPNA
jgi:hypothetical protein